jgi:8-oxo-dGTP diphosphatase
MIQRVAVKAIIENEMGEVLIIREAPTHKDGTIHGRYHFPGGRVEVGEPYLKALLREVREETQLEVEADRPVFVGEWFPAIRGERNQIVAIFFRCRLIGGEVKLGAEYDAYQWVVPLQAERFTLAEADANALRVLTS